MIRDAVGGMVVIVLILFSAGALVVALGYLLPSVGNSRNGATIYVDSATGCEYLSRRGLTPRVDGHGRHMGCR